MSASGKEKVALLLSSAALATGLLATFQPPSTHSVDEQRKQQITQAQQDLSDSEEAEHRRYRDESRLHQDAENARALSSAEHRPPEPHLKLWRLP